MTNPTKLRIGLASFFIAAFVVYFNACSNTSSTSAAPVAPTDLTITMTGGPADGGISASSVNFTFSVASGTPTFACTLDTVALPSCDPAGVSLIGLAGGVHNFTVQATDSTGVGAATSVTWTVDATGPSLSITNPTNGSTESSTFSFQFTSDDPAATHNCDLDGSPFACTPNAGNVLSSLPSGAHIIQVTGIDSVGNQTVVSVSFNVL